jgi:hypothetical protein
MGTDGPPWVQRREISGRAIVAQIMRVRLSLVDLQYGLHAGLTVRYSFADPTKDVCCYLNPDREHCFTYRTWEQLHAALIRDHSDLEQLNHYLHDKSAHFPPAFALG